jgi:hypothetical protein
MKIPFLYGEKAEVHRVRYGGRAEEERRSNEGKSKNGNREYAGLPLFPKQEANEIKIPHHREGDGGE